MTNESKQSSEVSDKCSPAALDPTNCGELLSPKQAKESLENYFNEQGVPDRNDPNHIYGHTFGLANINKLLDSIKKHNETSAATEQVHGIRVYYGKCARTNPEYQTNELLRDVFFMPVRKDGTDLITLNKVLPGDDILGGGRPCPNECKLTFIDKMDSKS